MSTALDQAMRKIGRHLSITGFGKRDAREMLASGFGAEAVRGRYGKRFRELEGLSLDEALSELTARAKRRRELHAEFPTIFPIDMKLRAMIAALRALRRFNREFWPVAFQRAATPWWEDGLTEYRHGYPVDHFQQAAE